MGMDAHAECTMRLDWPSWIRASCTANQVTILDIGLTIAGTGVDDYA
jgi:hypothetical protein